MEISQLFQSSVLLILAHLLQGALTQQCRSETSILGWMLQGHIYKTMQAYRPHACVYGPYFRPYFLFLCLFLSSLNRLKQMETFSKQLIFSFRCLLNITDRNLYEKIVSRIYKRQNVVIFGYCFHFSEVGLRESLLAAYLTSLSLIID